ncbi:MAG TPA: hypothetical protein P5256_08140 [Beijerinckiaceae bacterium]|nr:hypothetical protein [Hyphomicrobiales bacterium]MCO5086012.1 hypothetical protein [Methylobacteriaceae bacterium]HRY03081.1 hypothetical protein [Beijerinckiaceae bacterium]
MPATEIFVFGSNLLGRHGAGAARKAHEDYAARYGVGVGPTGRAYAIPTKSKPTRGNVDALPLGVIHRHVTNFLDYARANADLKFLVTRIGCGLAGFKDAEIAPLFADAPKNVHLPLAWHTILFGAVLPDRVSFTE